MAPVVEPMPPIASSRSRRAAAELSAHHRRDAGQAVHVPDSGVGRRAADVRGEEPAGRPDAGSEDRPDHRLAEAGRPHAVEITVTQSRGARRPARSRSSAATNALALTPPLGWNSWNAWGNTVTAERVPASADGMVESGLHRQGYTYINIDDVWEGGLRAEPATARPWPRAATPTAIRRRTRTSPT